MMIWTILINLPFADNYSNSVSDIMRWLIKHCWMVHFIEFQSESAVYKDEALTNKRLLWILYHVISVKHCLHVCWWYHLSTRPSYLPALCLAASCGQFSWSQLSWWPAAARQSRLYLVRGPDAYMRNHRDNHEYYLDWTLPSAVKRSIGYTTGFHNHGEGPY